MAEPALNYLGLKVLLLPFCVSWYNVSFDVKADNVLYFFCWCKKEYFYFDSFIQVFDTVVVECAILDLCWYKSAHIIYGFPRLCLVA
jgi:hypothetical protein